MVSFVSHAVALAFFKFTSATEFIRLEDAAGRRMDALHAASLSYCVHLLNFDGLHAKY